MIYNYECSDCGEIIELSGKYDEIKKCLVCKNCCGSYHERQTSVFNRIFSPPKSFILRGQGWYVTDYGKRKNDK